jgi:hypothetical protein
VVPPSNAVEFESLLQQANPVRTVLQPKLDRFTRPGAVEPDAMSPPGGSRVVSPASSRPNRPACRPFPASRTTPSA